MRNAFLFTGVGALVILIGGLYLSSLNTITAHNSSSAPSTADIKNTPDKSPQGSLSRQGASIGEENRVLFECAENKSIDAVFTRDILALTLSEGRQIELRSEEVSGKFKYVDSQKKVSFEGSAEEAFLTEEDKITYNHCITTN